MNPAFIPVWILLAPLAVVVADWLLAPKATSMTSRQPGATYAQSPGFATR